MDNLVIVQHCQSEHHVKGLTGGWSDTPLTELGRSQALLTGKKLSEMIDSSYKLISSDLMRASETAQIIGKETGLEVFSDSGLRERNFGIATGKTREWFRKNIPQFPTTGRLDFRPLEGSETIREFYERNALSLEKQSKLNVKNLLIVSHGGALNNIIFWYLNLPVDSLEEVMFSGKPGGISYLCKDSFGYRILKQLSDICHLERIKEKSV